MENQLNETSEVQTEEQLSVEQNRILTDAYALQVADQVLSNVERVQLKTVVNGYDLKKIRATLLEYKAIQHETSEHALQVEFRVLQEIQLWRLSLARRDEAIKAFHLRRFYDQNAASVNAQMLAALGCFYRSLTPSFENRSKYDFVVTQLFSVKQPGKPRIVRLGNNHLVERLKKFNAVWTGVNLDWADKEAKLRREGAVAVFDALRHEAGTFSKLEDLLKSGFFNHIRRHKQYLGETFFAPEVTAASIQCNVAIGNKFSQLVSAENESFRNSLELEHGGVDVLNLVLEEDPTESVALLKQIDPNYQNFVEEIDSNATPETENNEGLSEIHSSLNNNAKMSSETEKQAQDNLETTVSVQDSSEPSTSVADVNGEPDELSLLDNSAENNSTTESDAESSTENAASEVVNTSFLRILDEAAKRHPNEELLLEHLKTSPLREIDSFNLSNYLTVIEESTAVEIDLKSRALRLVLIAGEYCRKFQSEHQTAPTAEEINSLKTEIQTLINELREIGGAITGEQKKERASVLLTAVNNLFEVRLKLNLACSAVLNLQSNKFNNATGAAGKALDSTLKKPATEKRKAAKLAVAADGQGTPKAIATKTSETPKVNRGLLVAAIVVVLLGAGYYFFSPANNTTEALAAQTAGIVDVDLKTLTGGERLVVARISNNALIGVVNNDWKNVAIEKKRENLESLLKKGNELQFKSVLLFNSRGEIVGNATAQEITAK
jgi:hypothetical protein